MASTRIPRPPRFLVRLVLWTGPFVMAMLVIIGVLAVCRWHEYLTATRLFALALGQVSGWMYAWRLHRARA